MSMNITTKAVILECVGLHNNNIAVFVCGRANGQARGLGPGPGLKWDKCVAGRAGPGHTLCGPGLIIQFAGRSGPWPGLHNCCEPRPGMGLKSYLRTRPGPKFQARAGP